MGLLASDKFKPVIFMGLGGNGGKIVNQLAGRLKRHPHWDRIQEMTHFVVIDTNKDDLDKHRDISPDCRFLISSFDNAAYVRRKRGEAQFPPDPMLTQWIPPEDVYSFRSTQGAGAGQIRMESRLRLYYNLENDRARIRQKIRNLLHSSTGRENPWRDNEDKVIRVVIYGSVAGGTGSGAFIPMAYLMRQMIRDAGWGRPSITTVLSLPTTFINKVKPELQDDIKANGYAALKELEHLTRQLGGYVNGSDKIRFHYDPGTTNEDRKYIYDRPFDIAYLIDQPANMSIQKYEHAVADASYLQLFSPLLGAQKGEYDNYEKRQKQLASGYFSSHYGSFGVALLQLPRNDLVRYASLRYIARAFREYLCFGGDEPQFRVPYGAPAFERLAPEEKNRIIDQKFVGYVSWRAEQERKNDEIGVFTSIYEQKSPGGKSLPEAMSELLFEKFAKLDELMEIPEFKIQEISEGNPSISRQLNELRRTYGISRSRVITDYLSAQKAELRNGSFLEGFFKRYDVNPIAQRLFLIRLLEADFIVPFADPEEGAYLNSEAARMDLDSAEVQDRASRINSTLAASVDRGFFSSLLDRDNKEFTASKRRAIRFLNELADDQRESLQRDFWRSFQEELRLVCEQLLSAFRMVAEIADTRAREAEAAT
ncbi:MAG: tubulin-like doman-containing protein, partial [Myxococcota bacterium]